MSNWLDTLKPQVTAPGALTPDEREAVQAVFMKKLEPFVGRVHTPETREAMVDALLERPGDYLETRVARYPEPAPAELVVLWGKDNRPVLSITSGGKVQDFFIKQSVVAHMARQAIDLLHSSAK